jgi:hypothetical protein
MDQEKWCWCNLRRTTHFGPFDSFAAAVAAATAASKTAYEAAVVRADIVAEEEKTRANDLAKAPDAVDYVLRVIGLPAGARLIVDGFAASPEHVKVRGPKGIEHMLYAFARGFEPVMVPFQVHGESGDLALKMVRPRVQVARCMPAYAKHYVSAMEADFVRDQLEIKLCGDRAVVGEGRAFELITGAQASLESALGAWADAWVKSDAHVVIEDTRQDVELSWS